MKRGSNIDLPFHISRGKIFLPFLVPVFVFQLSLNDAYMAVGEHVFYHHTKRLFFVIFFRDVAMQQGSVFPEAVEAESEHA
ncbi:hypothetical protein SDC9_150186 [bioreactor metagenome]|uniref:Uncharacterized protein n=1 Tax=bioreactor metagenome TaxID=1076179 RepID=A0A645ELS4_9ZZZZ